MVVKANPDNQTRVVVLATTTAPPRDVAIRSPTPILMTIAFTVLALTMTGLSVINVWTPALLFSNAGLSGYFFGSNNPGYSPNQ